MVTYTYACKCGANFDKELPMGSTKKPRCPSCKKSKTVRRIIGVVAIRFVGDGFTKSVNGNEQT